MFRFTFRYGFLVMLLLFGMLIGMNIAEKGIYKVTGLPDKTPEGLQVLHDNKQVEVKVMGKTYLKTTTDGYSEKTDKQEKTDKISIMSKIGNGLGELLEKGTTKGLDKLASLVKPSITE